MPLPRRIIYAELARRKVQFHPNEKPENIKLWGLFTWGAVSPLIKSGELLAPGYRRENKIIWCFPSKETWEKHIEPLTKLPLDELTRLAGWS